MATLDALKKTLRQRVEVTPNPGTQSLSEAQYSAGFDLLLQGSGQKTYDDFITPQLSLSLAPLLETRTSISILEIGPGPKSVLCNLPVKLRQGITRYAAFEPNNLFATRLEESLCSTPKTSSPLPCLERLPEIHRVPFCPEGSLISSTSDGDEKFDVILFCHSMYGMKPKRSFIERALNMLHHYSKDGMVIVFHRDGSLHLNGLTCQRTSSFPAGSTRVADDDETLDCFAAFITGFIMQDSAEREAIQAVWREVCRSIGRREEAHPDHLFFSSPDVMASFTKSATALPQLMVQVPAVIGKYEIKNREARLRQPASILRPTGIRHVQQLIRWALENRISLSVVGGGHSGNCLWSYVVAIDMRF